MRPCAGNCTRVANPGQRPRWHSRGWRTKPIVASRPAPAEELVKATTPGTVKCEQVAALLNLPLDRTVKTIALTVEKEVGGKQVIENWLLLLRGDHELNEIKVGKVAGLASYRFANEAEILACYGSVPGYLGPIGTKLPVTVVADRTVANMADFVCGANAEGFHYTGANWVRDLAEPVMADLRNVVEGDASPDGQGVLAIERGIEVGHVFQLGTAYSEAMKATFLDENGKPAPLQMGCYGIGVTRILGAARSIRGQFCQPEPICAGLNGTTGIVSLKKQLQK